MRLVLLLLCLSVMAHSFYLSNYYYAPRNTWGSHSAVQGEENEMSGEENQMVPKTKRLKPCFYSPIQCMIRK